MDGSLRLYCCLYPEHVLYRQASECGYIWVFLSRIKITHRCGLQAFMRCGKYYYLEGIT